MMNDITPQELHNRLTSGEPLNLIDVREEWEYEERNLGARLVPLGQLQSRVHELESWKDQEVIVHCKAGGRSAQAKAFLVQNGFRNVRNLLGGIEAYPA